MLIVRNLNLISVQKTPTSTKKKKTNNQTYNKQTGSVHTTREKFENVALFLMLGLLSTII